MRGGRGGQTSRIVRLELDLPQFPPRFGVEGVEPAGHVAEHQRVPAVHRHREQRRAHRAVGLEHPLQAPGVGAHRVHEATGAADEQMAVEHRRLREGRRVALEAERPLQLEIPDLLDAESSPRLRLEACVVGAGAPAVPRDGRVRRQPDRTVRAVGARRRSGDGVGGAQVRGHGQALVAVHGEGDGHHRAGVERADDAGGRHLLQRFLRRDARIELIVAAGAAPGVDRLSRDRLCLSGAIANRR